MSFLVFLLACVCLTLLWKVLFGLIARRWLRIAGLVILPLILIGLVVFYSFRPFLLNRDRQYVAVLLESANPFNPIKFCSSTHKVDSDSRLIIANHPAHWWAARIAANLKWRDIRFLDAFQKRQQNVVALALDPDRSSKGIDASGAPFNHYRIPITESGLWTLRSEISQSALASKAHPSYAWKYGIGYAPGQVIMETKAVERDEAFAWHDVVAQRMSVQYFLYTALLSEYLTGRWNSDSQSSRKKLLEFAPNDRETLRILTLDLLVKFRIWQGNLLQVQYLPQLRRCETLVRQQEMTDTKDQLISWALDHVVRETDKMGPSFRMRLDDLRPISQRFNLANQPQYPDLTFHDRSFETKLKGLPLIQSNRGSFLHKGNFEEDRPLEPSPSWIKDLAKFAYTYLANQQGVPQSIDGITARDPALRKIYWNSLLERWTINSINGLISKQIGEANESGGSNGSFALKILEAILKIRKDAVQLEKVSEELGVKEARLTGPLDPAFQTFYSLKDLPPGDLGPVATDAHMLPNQIVVAKAAWLDDAFRILEGQAPDEASRQKMASRIESMIMDFCKDDPGTVARWQSVLKDPDLHPLLAKLAGFLSQKLELRGASKMIESMDSKRFSDFIINCFDEIVGKGAASAALQQIKNYAPGSHLDDLDNEAQFFQQIEGNLTRDLSTIPIFKYASQEARRHSRIIKALNANNDKSILGLLMRSLDEGAVEPPSLDWYPSPEQRMVKFAAFLPFCAMGGDLRGFAFNEEISTKMPFELLRWSLELGRSQTTGEIFGGYSLTAECLAYSMVVSLEDDTESTHMDEIPFSIFYNVVGITPREYIEGVIADQIPP